MSEFEDWIKKKNERRRSRLKKAKEKSNGIHRKPIKRNSRLSKKSFSEETRREAHDRGRGRCENPLCRKKLHSLGGEHHCLPKSQYFGDDINGAWNCAAICFQCHARITSPKGADDIRLRRYFERVAITRRDADAEDMGRILQVLESKLRDGTLEQIKMTFTKKS